MANRNFPASGRMFSAHVMPVLLDAQIVIGAAGAVASFVGPFIQSVTQSAAGQYTIVLQDNYASLLVVMGNMQNAAGASAIQSIQQLGPMVNSASPQSSGASIVIETVSAGVATNPASGAQINVALLLNNSSVQ